MSGIRIWTGDMDPDEMSARLFAGELLVFRGLAPIENLGERVRGLLQEVFQVEDPQAAESFMPAVRFREASVRARRLVDNDPLVAEIWAAALSAIGYPLDDLYGDRMRLRVVPSRDAARGRRTRPLPPHRDSWGAKIAAQINWWLPLYPLATNRTMVVWPDLFEAPVANTSAEWDFDVLASGRTKDYPLLPVAEEDPDPVPSPVLIEPGDLLGFSAAHLHASGTDGSGLSRLSLDTRTFRGQDVRGDRGAPNVDGAPGRPRWEWFARLSDGRNAGEIFGNGLGRGPVAA